jgi:hypothetical protein
MLRSVEILTGLSVTKLVNAVAVIGRGYDMRAIKCKIRY